MSIEHNISPLIGVKWTKPRMIKVHDMLLNNYIDGMMNQVRFSDQEKIKRIQDSYNWIKHIRNLCMNNDIAFKKKKKENKK